MKVERCPGMNDILPGEMRKFRAVEEVFRTICSRWGYEEVKTPVVEPLYLFTASGTLTPEMLGRVYSFLDWNGWSGERVVLRPESTIPTARLFIQELSSQDFARLFYVQDVFSFQTESRERWQCGAEFIGGRPPAADAELIMLALEVLRALNVEAELRLGHVGLVRTLLIEGGGKEEDLDRTLSGDASSVSDPRISQVLKLLMEFKGTSSEFLLNLKNMSPGSQALEAVFDEFLSLLHTLSTLNCSYVIDMTSGRGFEYYTGVIFHFFIGKTRLGGGGRYDNLLPLLGGRALPASGFALYLDELMKFAPALPEKKRVVIRAPSPREAIDLAKELHKAGYIAAPEPGEGILVEKTKTGFRVGDGKRGRSVRGLAELISLLGSLR